MEMRQTQLQSALDHARQEMFDFKTKQDDVTSARSSEVDILNQDLERANEVSFLLPIRPFFSVSLLHPASLERRTSSGQTSWTTGTTAKLGAIGLGDASVRRADQSGRERTQTSGKTRIGTSGERTRDRCLGGRYTEIAIDVDQSERDIGGSGETEWATLMEQRCFFSLQISDLENVLNSKERLIAQLEGKLHSQADYDEIKRELTWVRFLSIGESWANTSDYSLLAASWNQSSFLQATVRRMKRTVQQRRNR